MACRNLPLFNGDILTVKPGGRVGVVCLTDWHTFDWSPGKYTFTCQAGDKAPSTSDPFTAAYLRSRSVIRTHVVNGTREEIPRGGSPQDWLSRIVTTRPAGWPTSISLEVLIKGDQHQAQEERINRMGIPEDAKLMLLADLNAMSMLYDQAEDDLKKVSTAARDPLIQIFLGDLALARGEQTGAEDHYTNAATLAKGQKNPLAQAVAAHALGILYVGEEVPKDARAQLQTAIRLYRSVGEAGTATILQRIVSRLR